MFKEGFFHVCRDGEAGGAGGAGGPPPGGGGTGGDPWYKGKADDRTVGTWQNNFPQHINDPAALALAATNSWLEAQRMLGAPASELVRLPTKSDDPNWATVHKRLGKPDAATDYTLKTADGKDFDAPLADAIRKTAFALNLNKDAAQTLARDVAKFIGDTQSADTAAITDKVMAARTQLQQAWGQNFAANKLLAIEGAKALKMDAEMVNALESTIGYGKVMEMLRGVGARTQEGQFILANKGEGNNNGGPMTREQAVAKKTELRNDVEWVKKFNAGDASANREMLALDTIIANTPKAA